MDDLLERKNNFFHLELMEWQTFSTVKKPVTHQIIYDHDDIVLMRLAANRAISGETKDFKRVVHDNWPSFHVFINNDPSQQIIAIQERTKSFQNTESVIKAICNAVNKRLAKKNLVVRYEPIYTCDTFWNLFEKYKGRIRSVEFRFITPNMSNISDSLSEDLKCFAKATNAVEAGLSLRADSDSTISLSRNNATLTGLVEYSERGGGDITLKAKGVRNKISSKSSVKQIEIDELEVSGPADAVVRVLKQSMGIQQ